MPTKLPVEDPDNIQDYLLSGTGAGAGSIMSGHSVHEAQALEQRLEQSDDEEEEGGDSEGDSDDEEEGGEEVIEEEDEQEDEEDRQLLELYQHSKNTLTFVKSSKARSSCPSYVWVFFSVATCTDLHQLEALQNLAPTVHKEITTAAKQKPPAEVYCCMKCFADPSLPLQKCIKRTQKVPGNLGTHIKSVHSGEKPPLVPASGSA
jgi:hypothetical protein